MLKTWKKAVSLVLVLALSFVVCVPTFAEENTNSQASKTMPNEIILSKPGDVIVKDNGKSMNEILNEAKKEKAALNITNNSESNGMQPIIFTRYKYSICNISKPAKFNLSDPLTEYVENRYYKNSSDWPTVTACRGKSITVGVSVTTSVGVSNDIVSAGLGLNVSGSTTLSTSQSYTYKVGYGERGRILMKYTRNFYTFKCKCEAINNGKVIETKTGDGDAMSKPYNNYIAYQFLRLW